MPRLPDSVRNLVRDGDFEQSLTNLLPNFTDTFEVIGGETVEACVEGICFGAGGDELLEGCGCYAETCMGRGNQQKSSRRDSLLFRRPSLNHEREYPKMGG